MVLTASEGFTLWWFYPSFVLVGPGEDGHLVADGGVGDALLQEAVVLQFLLGAQRVAHSATQRQCSHEA